MCDYSLQGIRNRLAEQGETLVVHRFQTGSKGLASLESVQQDEGPKTWMGALKSFRFIPKVCCLHSRWAQLSFRSITAFRPEPWSSGNCRQMRQHVRCNGFKMVRARFRDG
jgi:hypothetical protein